MRASACPRGIGPFASKRACCALVTIILAVTFVPASPAATVSSTQKNWELSNPVSSGEYLLLANWGRSYLAADGQGNKLLYLEGNAYQRGYATGRLCPRSVYRMTHDFIFNMMDEMVSRMAPGLDSQALLQLMRFLWPLCQLVVMANMDAVPGEFLEEMRGIAEGCRAEGYDVTWLDVLTLNLGFDVLESLFAGFAAISCNEFAVFGKGTADGRLFHGRDFMFPTGGDVFSDEAMLIVHKPTRGYPLVASAAPGMVGVPTALNSRGVSCGMDMVASVLTRPVITGEGTLLLCRKAVQFGGSLDEAVALIRDSDRGVPWLYLLADGMRRDAVVLETVASSLAPPEDRTKAFLGRLVSGVVDLLFPGLLGTCPSGGTDPGEDVNWGEPEMCKRLIARLPEGMETLRSVPGEGSGVQDVNGVMVRRPGYVDPSGLTRLVSSTDGQKDEVLRLIFPLQGEDHPDLVLMTNHYVIPWKAMTYPSTGKAKQDSVWRYDTMLRLLLDGYGSIDRKMAMWVIDFLNPARCDYYGTDTSQSVKGHHVLMDNREKEMWSLHGYYDGSWAHVDLDQVLRGRRPRKKAG